METPDREATRHPAVSSGPSGMRGFETRASPALPSGEFPIATHFDVIRRFMSLSRNGAEPVEPSAVEGSGLPPGAARSNAAFLAGLGLLVEEKPGRFKPTGLAMQFINTQLADEGRGRRLLRSVVAKTWFGATAMKYLQAEGKTSYREEELVARWASLAPPPAGETDRASPILIEYLVYTGILPPSSRSQDRAAGISGRPGTDPSAPPSRSPAMTAGVQGLLPEEPAADRGPGDGPWEIVQTGEFYLKIRPKPGAVKRLRKQLDMLEQKMEETPSS
jgi:hypothetical protein